MESPRNNINRPLIGSTENDTQHNSPKEDFYWEEHYGKGLDSAEFRLNRPKALNSLTLDMCHDMLEKLQLWMTGQHEAPEVLMITGSGEKAFCAGGDIVTLYNAGQAPIGDKQKKLLKDFPATEYLLDYSLTKLKV